MLPSDPSDKAPNDSVDTFANRVREAIIAEINDPRNAVEPETFRRGLIQARILLDRELEAFRAVPAKTDGALDAAIGETIKSISQRFDEELLALTETELAAQWYFRWDERYSVLSNVYEFSGMLEMHKRRCRRWEEHYNGSWCVVERVRDKYLMPRIKEFVAELERRRVPKP